MNKARDILITIHLIYNGNWQLCYEFIKEKQPLDKAVIDSYKKDYNYDEFITILDDNYPAQLKTEYDKPPFVITEGQLRTFEGLFARLDQLNERMRETYLEYESLEEEVNEVLRLVYDVLTQARGVSNGSDSDTD